MAKRAPFIVIEGLDRSGKSTQAASLISRLEIFRIPARLIKFPDRTTSIGRMINSYLQSESDLDDHAIHLLFSANRWELATTIENCLNQGILVLCDRYAFSGIAFSASKGLSYEWCRSPDIYLPAPDISIFLDITPEKAKERGGYGEERYEKEEMQTKVRDIFRRIGQEMQGEGAHWVEIDAGRERSVVSDEVWDAVRGLIEGVESPLQQLWSHVAQ